MRHIVPISGKDSLRTFLYMRETQPDLPLEPIFNDTGVELPETYAWLKKVEAYIGMPIERTGANLTDIIDDQGILPSSKTRFCTRLAKIYPMEDFIGKEDAYVYYGIRADEERVGYMNHTRPNIIPIYPLKTAGIGLKDVWSYLEHIDLMPPLFFWQSMFDMVTIRLGEHTALLDRLDRPTFYSLFSWRSRSNCFFCFFQRQYEWIGLSEYHPDLFTQAARIEATTGAEGYNWRQDGDLQAIVKRSPVIKAKRAKAIADWLLSSTQTRLFEETEGPLSLDIISCGLMCGK